MPDGRPCACGKNGCWERYCSGTALATTAVELLARDHLHSPVLGRLAAVDPGQVTGQRVAAAAREGDPVACAAMADWRAGWARAWRWSPTSSTPS